MSLWKYVSVTFCIIYNVFLLSYTQFDVQTREWLTNTYLPALSGRTLYVGVGDYTARYHLLTQNPELFETVDFDLSKSSFGSPYKHHTIDFLDLYPLSLYNHICLYGVLGFPAKTPTSYYSIVDDLSIKNAVEHAHKLLKIGGTLLIGPSYDIVEGQGKDFWMETFTKLLSNKYECIFLGVGPDKDNIVWWGTKKCD